MNKDIEFLLSPGLWRKTHKIIAVIIFIMLFIWIGFMAGTYSTIKAVVSISGGFIDYELVEAAIYQYQHQIKNCYPFQNGTENKSQTSD